MEMLADTLILHIGLAKTGTTTLQKRCFEQFDNTITPDSDEDWKRVATDDFLTFFMKYNPSAGNTEQSQKYSQKIKNACSRTQGKPLFISNENIVHRNYFSEISPTPFYGMQLDHFTASQYIDSLKTLCPWISKIKIILTLRNQPEWLASLYAERSNDLRWPSQEDFEQRVRDLLRDDSLNGGGFLNWERLRANLIQGVGSDNVYVLLLEDIKTYEFWNTLSEASELPFDPDFFILKSNERENVRRTTSREWLIAKRNANFRGFDHTSRFWRGIDCVLHKNSILQNIGNATINKTNNAYIKAVNRANPHLDYLRGRACSFRLSDEFAKEIRTYCNPFNRDLAQGLGINFAELAKKGY
ncbi:MAG TPA: hypothetical protein VHO70_16645 [Chitinispirillaceae bacterium]|nr:hypothetical protein [Chitinispirillaceae bacterium]